MPRTRAKRLENNCAAFLDTGTLSGPWPRRVHATIDGYRVSGPLLS